MHRRFYSISIILAVVLVLLSQASAAPTSTWPSLFHRQGNGNTPPQPFTTQTVQTTQTATGPVTETCTFTFTPVTGPNGEPLVEVVRACTVTAGAPPPPNNPGSTTSSPPPPPPPPQTSAPSPPATSPPGSSTPTATTSTPGSSPTPLNPAFSSVALSTVTTPSPPPSSSPTPTNATPPSSSPDPASSQSESPSPVNTGTTAPDTTPSDATATPQGAFQIPGKKISVLPIGLGIFAGISVIALIVVGLVTYERTKYRKIFRQRKLAEQGSAPGFGGMNS